MPISPGKLMGDGHIAKNDAFTHPRMCFFESPYWSHDGAVFPRAWKYDALSTPTFLSLSWNSTRIPQSAVDYNSISRNDPREPGQISDLKILL